MNTRKSIKTLAQIALLGGIGAFLMFIQIPFGATSFYKLDVSDVPVLVGGFALGPVAGLAILALKNAIFAVARFQPYELLGLPMNFVATAVMMLSAWWIYQRKKTWKNAISALAMGILASTAVMAPMNYFVMPFFIRTFTPNVPVPSPAQITTLIVGATVPFNLVKGLINGVLTFLVYKRVSSVLNLKGEDQIPASEKTAKPAVKPES